MKSGNTSAHVGHASKAFSAPKNTGHAAHAAKAFGASRNVKATQNAKNKGGKGC